MSARRIIAGGFTALFVLACQPPLADARASNAAAAASSAVVDTSRLGELNMEFRSPNPHDDEPGPSNIGVSVQLQRVTGIDLSTSEGWSAAAALDLAAVLDLPAERFTDHRIGVSGTDGTVVFSTLPLGLWLARSPEDAEPRFEPFVLTIPGTAVEGDTWRYSFAVYPKARGGEGGDDEGDTAPSAPPSEDQPPPGEALPTTIAPEPTGPPRATPDVGDITAAPGETEQQRGILAETGAAVRWLLIGGIALILAGVTLLGGRRRTATQAPEPQSSTPADPTGIEKG